MRYLSRHFIILVLLIPVLLLTSKTASAQENKEDKVHPCVEDPRNCFDGYEEDGTVKPKDPDVKRTFDMPAIKAGFLVDFKHRDVLPHISVEVGSFELPKYGDLTIDVGVATSRAFVAVTWELIPIVKLGPSIWGGFNVRKEDAAFGVGISVLDF